MIAQFESEFETEEIEITVLLKDSCNGARVIDDKWLCPSVNFIACLHKDSEKISREEGRIEWMFEKKPNESGWGYDFEQYGIYRFLVRKCIPKELQHFQKAVINNRYMLVKVLEENVQSDRLLELKAYLSKPFYIETPYGQFKLDRSFSWFSANIELGEYGVNVSLETDEDNGETAEGALQAFYKIIENFEKFDMRNKEFAAKYLLDLANEWLEDDDREDKPEIITKDMFMKAIEISDMIISPDGSITLYYLDGDMFWGHVIEMDIESDGTCSNAHIAG